MISKKHYSFFIFILFVNIQISCINTNIIKPTFSKNIAPIIYKNCTPCHRPNQIGHFNLITYSDVQKIALSIKHVVNNKLMPPWSADANYTHFANEMILKDEEIKMIDNWVNNKCPIGDSTAIPIPPTFNSLSFLGKPDLVVPVKPNNILGNYNDTFLLMKVPFALPKETYIHSIEFIPGNTKIVHHVNADIVRFDENKKKNIFDGTWVSNSINDSTVRQAYKTMGLLHDDGSFPTLHRNAVNYLPGVIAQEYPDGIGDILVGKKNAFLFSDIHYGPSRQNTWDSSSINIFFSKTPPQRTVQEFQLGTLGVSPVLPNLIIPANTIKKVYSTYVLPQSISIITLNPHMHLLGKSFWAFAVKPNGDTIPLIKIPHWDFNWQSFYKPNKAIEIPQGATIYAIGIYDNTINNVNNPFSPPRTITDKEHSMRTTDEMFQFIITYLDYQNGDENLDLNKK